MGGSAFTKIQTGREATAGTKVAATAKQMGKLEMEEIITLHRPDEERGSLADKHTSTPVGEAVECSFSGDATFEQLPYWLENSIRTVSGAVTDTSAYTYTYTPNLTTANTPKTFTIEYGEDVQEHEIEYCVTKELEISGAIDGVWAVKANIFGRNLDPSSFTGALSDPTVEPAIMNLTKLYIDDSGGSHGGTEKALTLIDFAFKLSTGFLPGKHGGATLYFDTLRQKKITATLDMTLEFLTATEAERVKYVAGTNRLVRLEALGTLAGASTAYRTARIDMSGVYTKWSTLQDDDGATTVAVTLETEYDATWAKALELVVINAVSTLP